MGASVAAALSLLLTLAVVDSAYAGGALDRFERSHTSDSDDSKSDDSSDGDSDSSSSHDAWDDDDGSSSSSGGSASNNGDLIVGVCLIPTFTIPCLMPAHYVNSSPYGRRGLYIEPQGERVGGFPGETDPAKFSQASLDDVRHVEMELTGFLAMDEPALLSHRLQLTFWLGGVHLAANWEHFYERLETGEVDHLNFYRFHYGFNLLGPYAEGVELYPRIGVLLLHGERLTPAFDIGGEVRAYPAKPLAIYGSAIASVFELGPVLLDARAQVGVSLDGFEVRAGPRVLYQGDAAEGFWGPAATVLGRF